RSLAPPASHPRFRRPSSGYSVSPDRRECSCDPGPSVAPVQKPCRDQRRGACRKRTLQMPPTHRPRLRSLQWEISGHSVAPTRLTRLIAQNLVVPGFLPVPWLGASFFPKEPVETPE